MGTVRLYCRGDLGRHKKAVVGYSEPLPNDTFKDAGRNSKWLLHRDSLGIHISSSGTLQLQIIALSIRTTKLLSKHMLQFWPGLLFYVHCKIYSLFLNTSL